MLDQITPLILTYNEASNIERTLAQLTWAHEIIVVDSFSDDTTISILEKFKQVRIFQRKFDWHATQWNYGLRETGIETEWVLALDADYVLTNRLIRELNTQNLPTNVVGFRAGFTYCVFGKPLRGSLYPPVTVLFRKDKAEYIQDGHTQRVILNGDLKSLNGKILHDDRKSLSHWLSAQDRYIKLEAEMLSKKMASTWLDRSNTQTAFSYAFWYFYLSFAGKRYRFGWACWYLLRASTYAVRDAVIIASFGN